MTKTAAYELGVKLALRDLGLSKFSNLEIAQLEEHTDADALAKLLQQQPDAEESDARTADPTPDLNDDDPGMDRNIATALDLTLPGSGDFPIYGY